MVSAAQVEEYLVECVKSNLVLMIARLKNKQTSQNTTFTSCMHNQMLESNRDDVKLEAMRCVTVMTAKGKLSVPRTLFPHIVKNVSSKNPELKKLIYLYLTHFADQEPDLALLPVASLQKSLKSPNPLIRSSALKVLTSMRLNILSTILMATLRNSVNDLSPYVRKTVAHSIIKIYRLDQSLRPDLIEYIERLFNDKNSMVLSSAMAAYEVVCPERLDLVKEHYRRFCFILADCNEWGQTLMMKLLVRYILKTCTKSNDGMQISADQDPKILIRSAKPLVHSNNSAVVMAVIRLFIAIANHNEVRSTITRPLIRLLYSHREIQYVVLKMVEELTTVNSDGTNNYQDEFQDIDIKEPIKREDKADAGPSSQFEPKFEPVSQSFDSPCNNTTYKESGVGRNGYIELDDETESSNHTGAAVTETNMNPHENNTIEAKELNSPKQSADGDNSNCDDDEDEESDEEESDSEEDEEESDEEQSSDGDDEDEPIDNSAIQNDNSEESEKEDSTDAKKEILGNLIDPNSNKDPHAYRDVFRPYIKSFYVRHNDCTQTRLAKLRILTNLSSSVNVSQILRELQAYISAYVDDKEFVSAAIHAIGRCAILVQEVAHTCLNGLTTLLSNNNEHIVSEAIVVLRSQIINKKVSQNSINESGPDSKLETNKDQDAGVGSDQDSNHEDNQSDDKIVSTVIKQVTKLLPKVTAPQARATILWILAEFCGKNLTAAKSTPNVLRLIAKSFCQEDNFVKLQSLTLISKFILSLDKERKPELHNKIRLLAGYLFSLAKYDMNHDVRDRGRFLKKLLEDEKLCAKVLNGSDIDQNQEVEPAA